jgi:hypothetical protein
MEGQTVKSKKSSQRDSEIKVAISVSWQHTQEPNPAFKRLIALLLRDRSEKSGVDKQNELSE